MSTEHFEILVEEPSMEAFLRGLLPSILGTISFEVYTYQGKRDLLSRLKERLTGYAAWLPASWRILVIVDRDDDNCNDLKDSLESSALSAGLTTRKTDRSNWRVATRIAVEELEAWYFGEWEAVRLAYPRASRSIPSRAPYRICDAIQGGTWECFERELQRVGYFAGGLRKIEAARNIASHFRSDRCSSSSYQCLLLAMKEALS